MSRSFPFPLVLGVRAHAAAAPIGDSARSLRLGTRLGEGDIILAFCTRCLMIASSERRPAPLYEQTSLQFARPGLVLAGL